MKKLALAALMVAAFATPAAAHHVPVAKAHSDVEAFAVYLNEYQAQSAGVVEFFLAYRYAQDGVEKSDLAKKTQTALLTTVKHMGKLDVRKCFAPFDRLADEFFDTLIRYYEVVEADPAIAEALFSYGGTLYSALSAAVPDTLTACSPKAQPVKKQGPTPKGKTA